MGRKGRKGKEKGEERRRGWRENRGEKDLKREGIKMVKEKGRGGGKREKREERKKETKRRNGKERGNGGKKERRRK